MSNEPSIYTTVERRIGGIGDRVPESPQRAVLPHAVQMRIRRIRGGLGVAVREPLVHFLVIGAVLFGVSAMLDRSTTAGMRSREIDVSAAKLQVLKETWTARWGAPPDAK